MDMLISNIINEVNQTKQDSFTKYEIIDILNKFVDKEEQPILKYGIMSVNPQKYSVEINEKITILPRKEFQLLYYFLNNRNRIIRRNQILSAIWGSDVIVTERTIDVHICKIKKVLGNYSCITLLKGVGYMWKEF